MERDWTDTKRDEWIARRDEHRKKHPPPPGTGQSELDAAEKAALLQGVFEVYTKTYAWELQKHPTELYPAPFAGKLYLPLKYMGSDRAHAIKFAEGEDLNFLVYNFYDAPPDPGFEAPMYVTADASGRGNLLPKRHQFLGPAPRVTGYRFDAAARTARIEWWDPYVGMLWIGSRTWAVEAYFDEAVQGWVSRPRGDFDRAPDLEVYFAP
ncbi:hypothetical protein C8Q77DRAFT_1098504 [Trametes polyzona]|nr:hypothetical protein C8Q77DRAFT_1098504 [Trametes polyzona]